MGSGGSKISDNKVISFNNKLKNTKQLSSIYDIILGGLSKVNPTPEDKIAQKDVVENNAWETGKAIEFEKDTEKLKKLWKNLYNLGKNLGLDLSHLDKINSHLDDTKRPIEGGQIAKATHDIIAENVDIMKLLGQYVEDEQKRNTEQNISDVGNFILNKDNNLAQFKDLYLDMLRQDASPKNDIKKLNNYIIFNPNQKHRALDATKPKATELTLEQDLKQSIQSLLWYIGYSDKFEDFIKLKEKIGATSFLMEINKAMTNWQGGSKADDRNRKNEQRGMQGVADLLVTFGIANAHGSKIYVDYEKRIDNFNKTLELSNKYISENYKIKNLDNKQDAKDSKRLDDAIKKSQKITAKYVDTDESEAYYYEEKKPNDKEKSNNIQPTQKEVTPLFLQYKRNPTEIKEQFSNKYNPTLSGYRNLISLYKGKELDLYYNQINNKNDTPSIPSKKINQEINDMFFYTRDFISNNKNLKNDITKRNNAKNELITKLNNFTNICRYIKSPDGTNAINLNTDETKQMLETMRDMLQIIKDINAMDNGVNAKITTMSSFYVKDNFHKKSIFDVKTELNNNINEIASLTSNCYFQNSNIKILANEIKSLSNDVLGSQKSATLVR
jgi:hypothetical protein